MSAAAAPREEQESELRALPQAERATVAPREEKLSSPGVVRARAAQRGYFRWLRFSRLAQAVFLGLSLIFVVWAAPWLPKGLDTADYKPEVAFTALLLLDLAVAGVLAWVFRGLANRDRETLLVLGEVFDASTGLHSRTYLDDRLPLECERARRGGDVFSVLILQLQISSATPGATIELPPHALEEIAQLINRQTQRSDLVAHLGGAEIAVLANGVDKTTRVTLLQRLSISVEAAVPQLLAGEAIVTIRCGAATYGVDGAQPDILIGAARSASILAVRRGKAA
jgi:diguanylate cyclase (GGDEF)-like protein